MSWMIEIWMKTRLVSDSNCNTVNLHSPNDFFSQGTTNNVGLTFSVGDTTPWVTISIEPRRLGLVALNIILHLLV